MDYKRVLMLHFTNGMSSREIAATTGDGKSAVSEFLKNCDRNAMPHSLSVFAANSLPLHSRYIFSAVILPIPDSGRFSGVQFSRNKYSFRTDPGNVSYDFHGTVAILDNLFKTRTFNKIDFHDIAVMHRGEPFY